MENDECTGSTGTTGTTGTPPIPVVLQRDQVPVHLKNIINLCSPFSGLCQLGVFFPHTLAPLCSSVRIKGLIL
jgi:hypothetical protein